MKTHSFQLVVLFIMVALMGAQETVRAASYSYPFATKFSFKPQRGESIAAILETIYADFREHPDLEHLTHASALLQIDPELKKIACTVEREYAGQLGEALFEFLFDYGCGMELIEPTQPQGPTYTLRVCRIDPSKKFTVIVHTPESIRVQLNTGELGLAEVLRKAGLQDEECSAAQMTMNKSQIYATGKMAAIVRIWTLARSAGRPAERGADGKPPEPPQPPR